MIGNEAGFASFPTKELVFSNQRGETLHRDTAVTEGKGGDLDPKRLSPCQVDLTDEAGGRGGIDGGRSSVLGGGFDLFRIECERGRRGAGRRLGRENGGKDNGVHDPGSRDWVMAILSVWVISKSGGLVWQKDFSQLAGESVPFCLPRLSTNDYLVFASTFQR